VRRIKTYEIRSTQRWLSIRPTEPPLPHVCPFKTSSQLKLNFTASLLNRLLVIINGPFVPRGSASPQTSRFRLTQKKQTYSVLSRWKATAAVKSKGPKADAESSKRPLKKRKVGLGDTPSTFFGSSARLWGSACFLPSFPRLHGTTCWLFLGKRAKLSYGYTHTAQPPASPPQHRGGNGSPPLPPPPRHTTVRPALTPTGPINGLLVCQLDSSQT